MLHLRFLRMRFAQNMYWNQKNNQLWHFDLIEKYPLLYLSKMTSSFWINHKLTLCLILIHNSIQISQCNEWSVFVYPHPLEPSEGLERSSRFPFPVVFENSGKLQSAFLLSLNLTNFWKNLWLPLLVNSQCQPMNGVVFHECFCSPPACACSGTGTWCSSSTWGTYSKHFLRAQGTNRAQTCCIVTRQMVPHYYACNLQVRP